MIDARQVMWWTVALVAASCSPFRKFESQRTEDLATAATLPPAERAARLRDRILRDGVNAQVGQVFPQNTDATAAASRMRFLLADDYLQLGEALVAASDYDGALRAYEDALTQADKEAPSPIDGSTIRVAAFRGEQAAWKGRGEPARSEASRILSDTAMAADATERAALIASASARLGDDAQLAVVKRAAAAPGDPTAALRALSLGVPLAQLEKQLTTPAAPPPPPVVTPPTEPPAPTGAPAADVASRLKKLDDLKAQGVITEEEYERERARILKESL